MDWAIVVTGVVGLAGIGGTLLSARMAARSAVENLRTSISAEDARAKVAEKRRIYASCLAALGAHATANAFPLTTVSPEAGIRFQEEIIRTRSTAMNAVFEVQLISPSEVAGLANITLLALLNADLDTQTPEIAKAIGTLMGAMRRDLGERDATPDVPSPPAPR
jgi:hypothetical protein